MLVVYCRPSILSMIFRKHCIVFLEKKYPNSGVMCQNRNRIEVPESESAKISLL